MARMTLAKLNRQTSLRLQNYVTANNALATLNYQITWQPEYIIDATEKAEFENYRHAAASIRKDAQDSITPDPLDKASAPGSPPNTHRGRFLKRAIVFAADKYGAIIGPTANLVGISAKSHEFGGDRPDTPKVENYPARPFMTPALLRQESRYAGLYLGSIGT